LVDGDDESVTADGRETGGHYGDGHARDGARDPASYRETSDSGVHQRGMLVTFAVGFVIVAGLLGLITSKDDKL
jgi:hypothetical protein